MADVDRCIRYAEAGLCGKTKENAQYISNIPNSLRNIIFRDKSTTEIETMLTKYSNTIKSTVSRKFNFVCGELKASSDDNRDGADLFCFLPNGGKVIIEVKFGSYTDKTAGMSSFAQIFNTDIFTNALSTYQRKQWQNLVIKEYPDLSQQLKRTAETLNRAVGLFNEKIKSSNYTLSKESQKYLENYLLNNSGNYESHTNNYIRFEVTKDGSEINDVMLVKKGCGTWKVKEVLSLNQFDEKSRINIFAFNEETNLQIKFTLNNKNDIKLKPSGIKIRSKFMLNSPSWNVWIKPLRG